MYAEIHEAINFLSGFLISNVPRRKVILFGEQLANFLVLKYQDRWGISDPTKDASNRCLKVSVKGFTDREITAAVEGVGLEIEEIMEHVPKELTIFINPGEVMYRIEQGTLNPIYTVAGLGHEAAGNLFDVGPGGDCSGQLRLSCNPHNLGANNWLVCQTPKPLFELAPLQDANYTVGSFAMTRFGTTKKKTNNALFLKEIQQKVVTAQGHKRPMQITDQGTHQNEVPASAQSMAATPVPRQSGPRLPFMPPAMHQPGPLMPGPNFVHLPRCQPPFQAPNHQGPPFWTGARRY